MAVTVTATEQVVLRNRRQTAWFIAGLTLVLDAVIAGMALWIY